MARLMRMRSASTRANCRRTLRTRIRHTAATTRPCHHRHQRREPARLVEHRLDAEVPRGARRPDAVAVGRLHDEAVLLRRQIGVDRLAAGAGVDPVVIEAVEPVAEAEARGIGERQRR
jgi:hypothetical protein